MGYSTCAVSGCKSKPGQGLIFRKFPSKNPLLARQWLQTVPAGFRVTPNTAVCEVHFELTEFERPREDGKKRLKDSAVPRIFLSPVQSPARRPLGELSSNSMPTCTSTPVRKYASRSSRNTDVIPGISDHSYSSNRKKENRPPVNNIIADCLNSLRGYPSESITTEIKEKNDESPSGSSDTSAESGFSTRNICDMSYIFSTSDFLEMQMSDKDTSVANVCDMSSILCTSDSCDVIMNDTEGASDKNIATEKQVTDSSTATGIVNTAFEKTDGSPIETSDILADSGFSMGNVCDTSIIYCTSDFLEIPLNAAAPSPEKIDEMAMVEQEDFISDLSAVTRDNVLKLVAKQREEISRKFARKMRRKIDNYRDCVTMPTR